jgi:hypothetical protein
MNKLNNNPKKFLEVKIEWKIEERDRKLRKDI